MTEHEKARQADRGEAAKIIAEACHKAIDSALAPVLKRFTDLETKVAKIEMKGVAYKGVWQGASEYDRGDLVTLDGSIWHANAATRSRPGSGSADWTLAVKAGRDARDASR